MSSPAGEACAATLRLGVRTRPWSPLRQVTRRLILSRSRSSSIVSASEGSSALTVSAPAHLAASVHARIPRRSRSSAAAVGTSSASRLGFDGLCSDSGNRLGASASASDLGHRRVFDSGFGFGHGLGLRRPLRLPRPLAQPRLPLPASATRFGLGASLPLGSSAALRPSLGFLFRDGWSSVARIPRPRAARRQRSRTDPSRPPRPRRTRVVDLGLLGRFGGCRSFFLGRGRRASRGSWRPTRTTRSRRPGAGSGRCGGGPARCAARAAGAGRRARRGSADGRAGCRPSRRRAAGLRRRCAGGRTRRNRCTRVTTASTSWLGVVQLVDVAPRIGLDALEAQADALALLVDPQHLDLDLLADLEHLARVRDREPGQLGDVDQAVGPAEIDEGAELGQAAHGALAHLADLDLVQQLLAMLALPAAAGGPLRHDQAAALAVDFDDLDRDGLADEGGQVRLALFRRHLARERGQVRRRHEAAQLAEDSTSRPPAL